MARRNKLYLVFTVILIGGYVVYRIVAAATATPKDFEDARMKGGAIAQDIVNISTDLKTELAAINDLDKQGNYIEALKKITDVANRTTDIRAKAVELSGQLQIMTSALPRIGNEDAKQAVLDSVTNRLALLSRLINYSDYVYQLLSVLREKFTGVWHKPGQVAQLVDQINGEVAAINIFNQSAMAAMARFDKLQ
jgi:hypothetical protein